MTIEQLKKWCKERAEYCEGEMDMANESGDEGYYKYCDGLQYAYWSVYHKIEAEEHKKRTRTMAEYKQNKDGSWSEMTPEPYKPNLFERMFPALYEKITYWLGLW